MVTNTLKWTPVHSSEIEKANFRFEASVFNIDAKKAKDDLAKCKYPLVKLCGNNGLAKAHHFGRFKRVFVEKSTMPIYQPSQILDIKPKPDKFISDRTQTNIEALRVKENQLLLTCSGSIGKCTVVSKTLANLIFSHDLIRIEAKNKIDTGFIYTYLQTKTGQLVLATNNYGAVIQHIEPEHLENVTVPNPPANIKKEIHEKVMRSFALRDESNELIDEAEMLLIEALNLTEFDNLKLKRYEDSTNVQAYSVALNLLNDRFDGSYHVPIVDKIIDCLLDSGATILPLKSKEITSKISKAGIFKRIYVEDNINGIPFLGGTDILELSPRTHKFLSRQVHKNLIEKELKIKENAILLPCRGTIGNVVLAPKHFSNFALSDNALQIEVRKGLEGYIFIFLNTTYGRQLIRREISGAVIDLIDPPQVSQVPIPIIKDEKKIKEINDLALKANELRSEAYYLEQDAIKQMNEEVIFAKK